MKHDPLKRAIQRHRAMHPVRICGQVADAVRVEGREVVLACRRCGHESREDVVDEGFAQKMLRYWGRANGGISAFCAKCDPVEFKAWERRARARDRRLGLRRWTMRNWRRIDGAYVREVGAGQHVVRYEVTRNRCGWVLRRGGVQLHFFETLKEARRWADAYIDPEMNLGHDPEPTETT
jgi:hypothetical protein